MAGTYLYKQPPPAPKSRKPVAQSKTPKAKPPKKRKPPKAVG
jgi:hypothetical protein